ncbi:Cytochrome P450 3A4 [Tyrophagus putrescentiae]|nr:Cytochrome P450 3A4 [Tyrophagus putrescentiae]
MTDWTTIALVLGPIIAYVYWHLKQTYSFWSSRGVPGPQPLPLMGNMHQIFGQSRGEGDQARSREYGKMYGYYSGSSPVLMVTDAHLVKQLLVKDFGQLVNRQKPKVHHPVWDQNLFNAEDEQWRHRSINKLTTFLDGVTSSSSSSSSSSSGSKEGILKDVKEVAAGFTIDVIASTSFATETNCNEEKFFWVNPARALAIIFSPEWALNLLNVKSFLDPTALQWFIDLSKEMVGKRVSSGQKRADLVQLLLDAKVEEAELKKVDYEQLTADADIMKERISTFPTMPILPTTTTTRSLTETEIIAQSVLFFAAGFETTASTIFHAIFELIKNPDVQERLVEEIREALVDIKDESSVEYFEKVVNGISYLDGAIKETLRMYPPVTVLFRRVKAETGYTLEGVHLPKDTLIEINTYAIQRDPEYYPEPDRFNPERFLPENKHHLVPYTYLPFGAGPRNCIGMRFAYQEIKLCLAKVLLRYRFERTEGTPEKLTFKKASPLLNTRTFPAKVVRRAI